MVLESPLSTIARPAGYSLLFRLGVRLAFRRGRFRGLPPALGAQPQGDQGQRAELAIVPDILIPLEAFERRHRISSPGAVHRTRVVTLLGKRLLDFLIPLGSGLSLRGTPVSGGSRLRTSGFPPAGRSFLSGCALSGRSSLGLGGVRSRSLLGRLLGADWLGFLRGRGRKPRQRCCQRQNYGNRLQTQRSSAPAEFRRGKSPLDPGSLRSEAGRWNDPSVR